MNGSGSFQAELLVLVLHFSLIVYEFSFQNDPIMKIYYDYVGYILFHLMEIMVYMRNFHFEGAVRM